MVERTELERWQSFRVEMTSHKKRLEILAKDFLELGALEESASCAIKAKGLEYAIARMPKQEFPQK